MIIEGKKEIWDFQLQMKKALGIDLGEARVGVAISDDLGMLAHPLETIPARSNDYLERIVSIAADRQVESIIVGMPRNMDGSYGPAATKAREFIEKLTAVTSPLNPIWIKVWPSQASDQNGQGGALAHA